MTEENRAWAYLSRVVEPPSTELAAYVADVGPVEAADRIKRGVNIEGLARLTEARRDIDCAAADLDLLARLGGRLVTAEDPDWPLLAFRSFYGAPVCERPTGHSPMVLWVIGEDSLADVAERSCAIGGDKLKLFDLSLATNRPFTLPAVLTGVILLYIGNFGLDQDTTQRLLACKDARAGSRGLYLSVWVTLPVVGIFIAIGSLLYVFYDRPDLVGTSPVLAAKPAFKGADVTVFMRFILTEAPPGLRGLATIGVLATAVGTTMSALNAMSSVVVQDFYRPWRAKRGASSEAHYVMAGRIGMAATGLATLAMAVLSFYWQHYTNAPLLDFVLSVMNFAYAGLLGVYFVAVFTTRGSALSVCAALAAGFVVILLLQPYVADRIGLPTTLRRLAFPWQLCLGTAVSFLVCLTGRSGPQSLAKTAPFSGV